MLMMRMRMKMIDISIVMMIISMYFYYSNIIVVKVWIPYLINNNYFFQIPGKQLIMDFEQQQQQQQVNKLINSQVEKVFCLYVCE